MLQTFNKKLTAPGRGTTVQVFAAGEGRDFRFCIDRGGTFTDVYAEVPGEVPFRTMKLLSEDPANYESAPREGIRRILEEVTGEKIPRDVPVPTDRIEWIRMGTTVATNALLERDGERSALVVTKGFGDLLRIGNQARPDIFDLTVGKPSTLYEKVLEVNERVRIVPDSEEGLEVCDKDTCERVEGVTGETVEILDPVDLEDLKSKFQELLDDGIKSLAVVLLHSYTFRDHELAVGKLAEEMGFEQVSLSSGLVPMVRAVPRGHTASVDAYLTPCIKEYLRIFLSGFDDGLDQVSVNFMQSDGGLTPADEFYGYKAILSGPAGGVVGYALTTYKAETDLPVIGFDMGGTSTDVSRFEGRYEQVTETETAGVIVQAPQLDITTVAAGGGSKLTFRSGTFRVGPESVGSQPGPVCYRKGGELAITDANLLLGRVIPDFFPNIFGPTEDQPLDYNATLEAFQALADEINADIGEGSDLSPEEVALGFLNVANEAMCRPIREITEAKGYETKAHCLAAFGGAGPQHGCAIARALGMETAFAHRYCGILSAYGMGLADVIAEAQDPVALEYAAGAEELAKKEVELKERVLSSLLAQDFTEEQVEVELLLNMRYEGTDTAMYVPPPEDGSGDYAKEFSARFQREYGFDFSGRALLVDDVRVRGVGSTNILKRIPIEQANGEALPPPSKDHKVYFEGGWQETPVWFLQDLKGGHEVPGPAIIMNGTSTCLIEPECVATVTEFGDLKMQVSVPTEPPQASVSSLAEPDAVQLSIFNNRFMGIAEQMGRTLQRTSVSTNIKERLDFSCALFGPDGGLVANAPHVPVHLGAMSSTVQWQIDHWGDDLEEGDVLVTNHPQAGGSHLPDITVVTPVFRDGKLVFFTASRGHHADVGGITPGSMPPFSNSLVQEGAAIKAFKLVKAGVFQEEGICDLLLNPESGSQGTRKIEDNISDLQAQVAANNRGAALINDLIGQYGLETVQAYMNFVQSNAERAVREMLCSIAENMVDMGAEVQGSKVALEAMDQMDDGSRIQLKLTINRDNGDCDFNFEGTTPEVYGNWNAPVAVTSAAIIYCLRCLVNQDIPLNQGCFAPVTMNIPVGCMLAPTEAAGVVGGNVLTSMRVTDVILAAFGACANSQGCMNNLTFGDESFGYYETIGGGSGAGPGWEGASGVQCHMTNTRITDPEILERRYPVILRQYSIRKGSGGDGAYNGGDGIVREMEFLRPITVSILSERRVLPPNGSNGGENGAPGLNILSTVGGRDINLGGKNTIGVQRGDRLTINTPGGGGWGSPGALKAAAAAAAAAGGEFVKSEMPKKEPTLVEAKSKSSYN